MAEYADAIAACVLRAFEVLPKKAKPTTFPDGTQEWVPLSGIVLGYKSADDHITPINAKFKYGEDELYFRCVALGTGMKCLPLNRVALASGRCLHDWHAEIVAIRAFNLFLLQECSDLLDSHGATPTTLKRRSPEELSTSDFQPFAINDDIRIFMYSSEAPCGDASMELVMNTQDDATPWKKDPLENGQTQTMKGRGFFSELGIVRRKPSRGDAPETLSKSCSDKFAMRECTSLLSSPLSLLVHPKNAYLHELVLPSFQYIARATDRAFGRHGRMLPVTHAESQWLGGYSFRAFTVSTTSVEFSYSRRVVVHHGRLRGSNVTAMWTPKEQDVLIGGMKAGFKQFLKRGSSAISKGEIWRFATSVSQKVYGDTGTCESAILESFQQHSYDQVKSSPLLQSRRQVKDDVRREALRGWVRNDGGECFSLDQPG